MKKKKMSVGLGLILAVLFLIFGTGDTEKAEQSTAIVNSVVQEIADADTDVEEPETEIVPEETSEAESEPETAISEAKPLEAEAEETAEEPEDIKETEAVTESESETSQTPEIQEPEPESSVPAEAEEPETETFEAETFETETHETEVIEEALLDEDGTYDSKEDVALYIHQYGCLPSNYISKKDAQALGWEGGSVEKYAPGKCIGGARFGNYEGLLPEKKGRTYTECDIDTLGRKSRGAKRIVFSNDGLIYYTEDHYESFELLYGEE